MADNFVHGDPERSSFAAPLLTVLIPTRNRWRLVLAQARAVDHVLRGFDAAFEIVIHDNSTQAGPVDLDDSYPLSVRYIRSPELYDTAEENICAAFPHCRGEYVWMLADDDGVEDHGVAELLDILRRGEEDIIVFNSRHGRDERLAGEGAYVTERERRLFYEKHMRCSISTFVQRTGFFYWLCAISTVIVRRSIADLEPLRKYLSIARIYAHVAWLIEIGKDRRFLFVNRPLVVYGLLPSDHDGGRHWRSVGVREGGYSNSVWTGLWLRVLDELVAREALTLPQIRRTAEMNHSTRFHFGSNLAHQVLEQLADLPELPPEADLAVIRRWLLMLFPGAIFLTALVEEATTFALAHEAALSRVQQESRHGQTVRTLAGDLRERLDWWRRAIGSTPWYAQFYVETLHLYDVYDFGEDWIAAHTSFGALREALEVIDLPSIEPAFLRASSYEELTALIARQPLSLEGLKSLRSSALTLPNEWSRLVPERLGGPSERIEVTVAAPPPAPTSSGSWGEEVSRLRTELARQDRQLGDVYGSTTWRMTAPLRSVLSQLRGATPDGAAVPTLEIGAMLDLSDDAARAFLPRGFSPPEEWGCWTDGPIGVFRCRHSAQASPAMFEVWPKMMWRREGERSSISVSVNGSRWREWLLEVEKPQSLKLSAKIMANPVLEISFRPSVVKAPDEEPLGEGRRLGIGLSAMRLSWLARA